MACTGDPPTNIIENVMEYYGKTIKSKDDFKTSACATSTQKVPKYIRDVLKLIHDEVTLKYFGCGLTVPDRLENMKILDLGSGGGRDCYALSKLVGESGFVTGVDMTEELLSIANRHIDYHTKVFGFKKPNVKFVKGFIEKLDEAGIEDNSVDIIISNCVIDLCQDKKAVFSEAYRVLKEGGELYFSDLYAEREASDEIRNNKVLWGEGMGGALQWEKLFTLAKEIGFEQPRAVTMSFFDVSRPELKELIGDRRFAAVVYRLYKLPKNAERKASEVIYKGSIPTCQEQFKFDYHQTFKRGQTVTVDGSTSAILEHSRFKDDFTFQKVPDSSKLNEVTTSNPFAILDRASCNKPAAS